MTLFPPELLNLISPILPFLNDGWKVFEVWWWVFPPFLLWGSFLYLYRFWRQTIWDSTVKKGFLEIRLREKIEKPIKAMDYVFAGFHAIHDVMTFREKWIEGQFQLSISLEIVSIDGKIHFFIRMPEMYRDVIESNIYSQYPEVEIVAVEDYTKQIPADIPNREWDLFGMSWENTKPNGYPIKTYINFENEAERLEERTVDPLSGLLEGLSTLGPGEQTWLQILCTPIRKSDQPWIEEALTIRDKLVRRPEKAPPPPPMITEAIQIIVSGPPKKKEEEKDIIPPEMKLTPGEREIVQAIEQKISKSAYSCHIRTIYLGRKDAFLKARARVPYGFFKAISSESIGGLKPNKDTMTKYKSIPFWFLDKRRVFLRKRRLFRDYCKRWTPYFPKSPGHYKYVLNTEELATLYHFPSGIVAPTSSVERIETRKREAPKGLPIE